METTNTTSIGEQKSGVEIGENVLASTVLLVVVSFLDNRLVMCMKVKMGVRSTV